MAGFEYIGPTLNVIFAVCPLSTSDGFSTQYLLNSSSCCTAVPHNIMSDSIVTDLQQK